MSISKNKTYQLAVVNKSVSSHHKMDNKTDPSLVSYLTDFTGKNNLLKQSVKWYGQKRLLGLLICRNRAEINTLGGSSRHLFFEMHNVLSDEWLKPHTIIKGNGEGGASAMKRGIVEVGSMGRRT